MAIFTNTAGVSPEEVFSIIKWVLTFVVILFSVSVIKGSYARWIKGDMEVSDVLFDVSLSVFIVVYISFLID
ncbi:hypothetical protein CXF64_19995 [Pseudoalteromonas sp. GutCa3]|nr:hypothetical protein CXF64_19995 [Pseudoalteromonas sp. GutCa3]